MRTLGFLLIAFFFTTSLLAQTEIKGARSWKTVSSLLGKTITEASATLRKAGLTDPDKEKDKTTGLEVFSFYPEHTKEKEYEAQYLLGCLNEKVVYVHISYEYKEELLRSDIEEMKKNLLGNDFTLTEEKREDEFYFYFFQSAKQKSSATIVADKEMATFLLIMGEPKYVKAATE